MNKIRRNLFSNLQKTAGRKSFRRIIHVSFITTIFILAGCSLKPIPSATATATYQATATSTAILNPTPTIAPKPDYVTDENSVQTDSGIVFVKDGEAMLYDSKTGEITAIEDISTKVTFNSMIDTKRIVDQIFAEELTNQNLDDYYPGKLSQPRYKQAIENVMVGCWK